MQVTYHRGKLVFLALVLIGFAATSVYGLHTVPAGANQAPRLLGAAVAAAMLAVAARFLFLCWTGRVLVLTVAAEGLTFHQPALGAVPWSALDGLVHKRNLLQRSLGFRFRKPAPRLPAWSRLLYYSYRITEGRPAHVYLPLPLLAQSDTEIAAAVLRHRPDR